MYTKMSAKSTQECPQNLHKNVAGGKIKIGIKTPMNSTES